MEFLATIPSFLGGYIVPFILVLSLIVFIHEMGHYLAGRWCGIRVVAFSVGFGPEILGWTDSHGTRWKISAIPLGGYVKFFGDEDAASKPDFQGLENMTPEERETTFLGAKLWKRALAVAAGPAANFVLAFAIFTVLLSIYGKAVSDPVVADLRPGSAAEAAGILPGDRITALDGYEITTFSDIQRYVSMRPGVAINTTVMRGDAELSFSLTPQSTEIEDNFGNKMKVGIIGVITDADTGNFRMVTLSVTQSMKEAVSQCWGIVAGTFEYIGSIFAGRMDADQLGGPIRVAQASGQMASIGVAALLQLAAVLSVSIGLLNLMPVPVLDGGHLVFYAIEAVRGKPVGEKAQDIAFRVGLALVLSLMVFATWNDIMHVFWQGAEG